MPGVSHYASVTGASVLGGYSNRSLSQRVSPWRASVNMSSVLRACQFWGPVLEDSEGPLGHTDPGWIGERSEGEAEVQQDVPFHSSQIYRTSFPSCTRREDVPHSRRDRQNVPSHPTPRRSFSGKTSILLTIQGPSKRLKCSVPLRYHIGDRGWLRHKPVDKALFAESNPQIQSKPGWMMPLTGAP